MNGFLNIYKPRGVTSARCLSKVKKIVKCKCGHMGTLDPLACGVLPVALGQATRLFDIMTEKQKKYIAEFTFGTETDTLDLEGKPVFTGGRIPTKDEIIDLLPHFIGEIDQVPPAFSAKCVDGKKSYKLARSGVQVELKPKRIEIYDIKLLGGNSPAFTFEITCGGGTYIRAIARDLGRALGTYGTMTALERVQSGFFTKERSVTVEELIENGYEKYLIGSDEVLHFKKVELEESKAIRLLNGLYDDFDLPDGRYRVYVKGVFWGVGNCENKKIVIRPYVRD